MTQSFEPRLRATLIDVGRGGAGPAEIAGALGWTRRRMRAAAARRTVLTEALERAGDGELAWWEARARVGVAARPNAALWGRAMAGRFASEGYGRAVERTAPVAPAERGDTMHARAKAVMALLAEGRAGEGDSR